MDKYFISFSHRAIGACFKYREKDRILTLTKSNFLLFLKMMMELSYDMEVILEKFL